MTGDRPPADEQALVASALAGDEGALGRLLGLHQQSAYNVAYRLLGSEADARDAVQEAFLLTVRAVRGERAALTLREYEGFSYDEIAALLGVSRGAVERLLFRARRGFRDAYEGLTASTRPVGCPEFVSLLSAAADNELSTAALQDLNAHLDGCTNCRRELDGLRRARELVALMPLLAT